MGLWLGYDQLVGLAQPGAFECDSLLHRRKTHGRKREHASKGTSPCTNAPPGPPRYVNGLYTPIRM